MAIQQIRSTYYKTSLGRILTWPIYKLYYGIRRFIPDPLYIRIRYWFQFGDLPKLNRPTTFNEKLNWLKLHDRTELHTQAADKFRVREIITDVLGSEYLIPLLYHTKNPEEIHPGILPEEPFIIKTNHNSSGGVIVRKKADVNWLDVQSTLKKLLKENYYYAYKEWQYKNIEPRIVVEKLLVDENGNIPYDYKLHCFNGKVQFTQVDLDRHINHTRNLYDREWNLIPCEWKYPNGPGIAKPKVYAQMQKLAEKIAEKFIYVRVDLYTIGEKIYFGELTFHSESAFGKFNPQSYDEYFGKLLRLPVDE